MRYYIIQKVINQSILIIFVNFIESNRKNFVLFSVGDLILTQPHTIQILEDLSFLPFFNVPLKIQIEG